MSDNGEQQMSHADRHDLDKLVRWKSGLEGDPSGGSSFPACAIFLVGPEDREAHDIFRRYRSEFEALGGGFHHLVIFGQHGVSTTQAAFVGRIGLGVEGVPALVIAPTSGETGAMFCLQLPKGDRDGDLDEAQVWANALRSVKEAVSQTSGLDLRGMPGVRGVSYPGGTLAATIDAVSQELGPIE